MVDASRQMSCTRIHVSDITTGGGIEDPGAVSQVVVGSWATHGRGVR